MFQYYAKFAFVKTDDIVMTQYYKLRGLCPSSDILIQKGHWKQFMSTNRSQYMLPPDEGSRSCSETLHNPDKGLSSETCNFEFDTLLTDNFLIDMTKSFLTQYPVRQYKDYSPWQAWSRLANQERCEKQNITAFTRTWTFFIFWARNVPSTFSPSIHLHLV
jgi:hypothetical protein